MDPSASDALVPAALPPLVPLVEGDVVLDSLASNAAAVVEAPEEEPLATLDEPLVPLAVPVEAPVEEPRLLPVPAHDAARLAATTTLGRSANREDLLPNLE